MGMDEEERLFCFVWRQRWGTFEDLLPDTKYYLSEASQTLVYIGGAHASWRIVAFAVIFMIQIPKGDSGEFTLESTTNVTARNRILASHIITLRNNLCTAEDYVT